MRRTGRWMVLAGALAAGPGGAQSGGSLEIRRSTIDGGGGVVAAPPLRLTGTLGQPDAQRFSAGSLVLRGGFWGARVAAADSIFRDGFEP